MQTGPRPAAGKVTLLLGVENKVAVDSGTLEVRVNGEVCEYVGRATLPKPDVPFPVHAYAVPLSSVQRGRNLVEAMSRAELTIGWVELDVEK